MEIAPSSTRWTVRRGGKGCPSEKGDCETRCLEETPARYKTVKKTVLKSPATTREIEVPAEYQNVTKTVVDTPASTREVDIPPVYRTVKKRVLKTPASTHEVDIPAVYQTVSRRKLVEKGGYTEWQEAVCDARVTSEKVRRIQQALNDKGYRTGPVDNVLGPQTHAALARFQEDQGLPVGGLNLRTLAALDVEQ